MKPRDRSINVFNMSMLDVVSGALGAFLIVMIVLFPYYQQDHIDYQAEIRELEAALATAREQADEAREAAEAAAERAEAAERRAQAAESRATDAEARAAEAESRAERAEARAAEAEERLRRTFLVVYISWGTAQDVDLHVVDPEGNEFNWENPTISGRPGELSEDNTNGPGTEVWEIREAEPGEYEIYANLYSRGSDPSDPSIRGRAFFRDGSAPIEPVTLTQEAQDPPALVPLARITVDADGGVSVDGG